MAFRRASLASGPGLEPRAEPPAAWDDAADAGAAPSAAPEQLSLFVFDDDPAAAPRPRLRRLKGLLAALETQRPAPAAHGAPTPLWPDSFFD